MKLPTDGLVHRLARVSWPALPTLNRQRLKPCSIKGDTWKRQSDYIARIYSTRLLKDLSLFLCT